MIIFIIITIILIKSAEIALIEKPLSIRRSLDKMYTAVTATQFYLYGKKHFTKTGWMNASKNYKSLDLLKTDINLSDKVYMITGANAGIGREITTYLASKNATVYMVCRSPDRSKAVLDKIISDTNNNKVHLLLGDCGLERDIRRLWDEFVAHRRQVSVKDNIRLDALVCNAGALMNEKTISSEGVEVTFATHLLFGTYLLGSLALPILSTTQDSSRIIHILLSSCCYLLLSAAICWLSLTTVTLTCLHHPQDSSSSRLVACTTRSFRHGRTPPQQV